MAELLFDVETDGLLDALTKVHCIVALDKQTGELHSFGPTQVAEGLQLLADADVLWGHNSIGFDIPALKLVYPDWQPRGLIRDTLVMSRLLFPDIKDSDWPMWRRNLLPTQMVGSHSLKAWGYRLGLFKDGFGETSDWSEWSEEMQRYCEQDVRVTARLLKVLQKQPRSQTCVDLEHDAAAVCFEIERTGFPFDVVKAERLQKELVAERAGLRDALKRRFGGWWENQGVETVGRSARFKDPLRGDRVEGTQYTKTRFVTFNPTSRDHIARCLQHEYGWRPEMETDTGKPKIDETVLSGLHYPEAPMLARSFILQKRLGQLAEGRNSWLKLQRDGRLRHRIIPCGAVTGRATHSSPNIAQVPGVKAPWGAECRELFKAEAGMVLLGTDMSGLELRCLGHYLDQYDGGGYSRIVVQGSKEDGTDVHSVTARALGLEPTKTYDIFGKEISGRDIAKTYIYGMLYGGGKEKLGQILGGDADRADEAKFTLSKRMPALERLQAAVQNKVRREGKLLGLDRRTLRIRKPHAALNTLLQSAGAIICKQWMVLLHQRLTQERFNFRIHAWVHDELQISCDKDEADAVGKASIECAQLAGETLKVTCPLTADYEIGQNWKETH